MTSQENDQRRLQELLLHIRSYQAALQDMSKQIALSERAMSDLSSTVKAIGELPKSGEALVPIGAGAYIKANLAGDGNVIVASGAGVHISKSPEEAKEFLDTRLKSIEKGHAHLLEQYKKASNELEAANQSAEELYAKLQKA
jgi:prefoldin alpha subunit